MKPVNILPTKGIRQQEQKDTKTSIIQQDKEKIYIYIYIYI